jgi:polyphosphate kinase 2 (PPK2 family)
MDDRSNLRFGVKTTGAKVCIVFEGRHTAGKGDTIKRSSSG